MVNPGSDKLEKSLEEQHDENLRRRSTRKKRRSVRLVDFYHHTHSPAEARDSSCKCQTCGRLFQSLKGVHVHERVHKTGKKTSGASPPSACTYPSGSSLERGCASAAADNDTNRPVDAVPESATVLLNSTQQVHSALAPASSSASRHLLVDLNRSPPPEEKDGDDGDNIDVDIRSFHEKEG